jgi:hypothetical protein
MTQLTVQLTAHQTQLHQTALSLSREHRELEAKLCACLREIDRTKLFRNLGYSSLFMYSTRELGLSEASAYAFIAVARKSREIPELQCAIEEKTLSIPKTSRLVSGLTAENANELITFAQTHTTRELERELARQNPEHQRRDRVRFVDGESVEIRAHLPKSVNLKLERVMALVAQKGKKTDFATVLDAALDEYIKHHDPVVKARRAHARIEKLREKHGAHEGAIYGEVTANPSASSNSSSSSSSSSNYPASYPPSRGERGTEPATNQEQTPRPISNREAYANKTKLLRTRRVFSGDTESSKASDPSERHGLNEHHGLNQREASSQGLVRDKVAEACVSQPLTQTHPALAREANARTKCGSKISKAPTPLTTQTQTQAQTETQAQALTSRRPLSASEKHAVFLRDQGRCTFVNARGERCNTDRWLHVHHIKPVSQGGTNDPANLTVICSAHHDLVHQLSFALDWSDQLAAGADRCLRRVMR